MPLLKSVITEEESLFRIFSWILVIQTSSFVFSSPLLCFIYFSLVLIFLLLCHFEHDCDKKLIRLDNNIDASAAVKSPFHHQTGSTGMTSCKISFFLQIVWLLDVNSTTFNLLNAALIFPNLTNTTSVFFRIAPER